MEGLQPSCNPLSLGSYMCNLLDIIGLMSANIWRSGILIVEAYLTEISQRSRFDVGFPILHSDQLRRKRRQEDFRPSRSGGPIFRAGDQNIRVVVPDAVGPGADGAPFGGAHKGSRTQVEAPRHWRRRIEPVGKLVGVDDRRMLMVDVRQPRRGLRCDHGEGTPGILRPRPKRSHRAANDRAVRPHEPGSRAACRGARSAATRTTLGRHQAAP